MTGRVRRLQAAAKVALGLGLGMAGTLVPIATAPPASACPAGMFTDPYTGRCYTQGALPTVSGIPCIPGKSLGTCLSILQNQPVPGGGAAPPGGPWP
jgi:hypothetical protein